MSSWYARTPSSSWMGAVDAEKPDQDGHQEVLQSLSEIRKVCAKILSNA